MSTQATDPRPCEVYLTLTEEEHRQLGSDIRLIRRATGAHSNTEAILQAARNEANRIATRNGS